jgi:hypothetical protein
MRPQTGRRPTRTRPAPLAGAPPRHDIRRAADALRLLGSASALLLALLLAVATRGFARRVQHGLLSAAAAVPPGVRGATVAAVQIAAALGLVALVTVLIVRRRGDGLLRVVAAAALAAASAWVLIHAFVLHSRPADWPAELGPQGALLRAGWPSAVFLAGYAAAVTAGAPWLTHRWRRALRALVLWSAALCAATAVIVPLEAVVALAVGATAASAVLVIGGAADERPVPAAILDALVGCGIPAINLHALPSAEQRAGDGVRYVAVTSGPSFSVRVLAAEDRDRDVFRRWSRRLLLSDPGDQPVQPSAAVEHELLMLVAARRAGAGVPEAVTAFPVAGGAMLVTAGEQADRRLGDGDITDITDAVLVDAWTSVARLQERRIAHRALIPDHVLVAPDGTTGLTAFARGRLDASAADLGSDLAVLLASTALLVGVERAVKAALDGLGADLLATVVPYLQPLALIGPTRRAVADHDRAAMRAVRATAGHRTLRPGKAPNLLREVSAAVREAAGVPSAKPAPLARFTWKRALSLVGAFLVIQLVLPQLAHAGSALSALRTANWWWILAALPTTFASQAFSAFLLSGTIPEKLPFGPNFTLQLASSFLNRITPNNVGGMALNMRFLQKAGVETGAATASVGLQSLAGALSNVIAATVFFAWAGQRHGAVHLHMPAGHWLLPVLAAALVACALLGLTRPGRRFLHEKVWRFITAAGATIASVASSPTKVAEGIVGAR